MKTTKAILAFSLIYFISACLPAYGQSLLPKSFYVEHKEIIPVTKEEKQCARILQTPDKELTHEELLHKYRLIIFIGDNDYIKNGELKTRLTEKDFINAGFSAFYYKILKRDLEYFKEVDSYRSIEESTKSYQEMIDRYTNKFRPIYVEMIRKLENNESIEFLDHDHNHNLISPQNENDI